MKTAALCFIAILSAIGSVQAIALSTFSSLRHYKLQVIIDGKTINPTPKPVVKIKSRAGVYQLRIKAFDKEGCLVDVFHKAFYAKSGYDSRYQVYVTNSGVELKCTRRKVIYHERLRRPDRFYNKRYIALHNDQPGFWFSIT